MRRSWSSLTGVGSQPFWVRAFRNSRSRAASSSIFCTVVFSFELEGARAAPSKPHRSARGATRVRTAARPLLARDVAWARAASCSSGRARASGAPLSCVGGVDGAPYAVGGGGHVEVADAEGGQRVHHRVDHRGQSPDGSRLTGALGAQRVER